MKVNKDTIAIGAKVTLVSYKKTHVLRYNEWMKSEELQILTASEPLTLEQEYDMQISWLNDEKKCTFIVLANDILNTDRSNEIEAMIGDVNLFFNDDDNPHCAEIEVMIAVNSHRGKGCGKETVLLMMMYGIKYLGVKKYSAKIGFSNIASQSLFLKLGFEEVSRSDVFEEITYTLNADHDEIVKSILEQTENVKVINDTKN